ncbi:MAG: hypothetical protein WA082_04240 [Candidatus Moraniibacteriota bacterium]
MKYVSYSHYFTWRHWVVIYAIMALFSFAPLLSVMLASVIGHALGCGSLGEGMTADCPGGGVLQVLFTLGWFGLITFPFGGFLTILLLIANILWYFTHKSGQDRL